MRHARENERWRRIPDDIGDLVRAEPPVDGRQDGAEPGGRAIGRDEVGTVVGDDRDAIAGPDARDVLRA
jgi:hypothetical protein